MHWHPGEGRATPILRCLATASLTGPISIIVELYIRMAIDKSGGLANLEAIPIELKRVAVQSESMTISDPISQPAYTRRSDY